MDVAVGYEFPLAGWNLWDLAPIFPVLTIPEAPAGSQQQGLGRGGTRMALPGP